MRSPFLSLTNGREKKLTLSRIREEIRAESVVNYFEAPRRTYLKEQNEAHPLVVGVVFLLAVAVEFIHHTRVRHLSADLKQFTSITISVHKNIA